MLTSMVRSGYGPLRPCSANIDAAHSSGSSSGRRAMRSRGAGGANRRFRAAQLTGLSHLEVSDMSTEAVDSWSSPDDERRALESLIDEILAESFPANDPPRWSGSPGRRKLIAWLELREQRRAQGEPV